MDRLDDNWRAIARKNPAYRKAALGKKVALDPAQRFVYAMYLQMRRQSNPDGGIRIPPDTDPLLERHLLAMDRVLLEDRAKQMKARTEQKPKAKH